jgi:hypothetical protein
MISPNVALIGKTTFKVAVILAAVEIAAYEISPETFSTVAVGVGALAVAGTAVVSMILTNRNNRKNRDQIAQIARDQATALLLQDANSSHLKTLEVRMDGRVDKLISQTEEIYEAIGVKKGLRQAADAAALLAARDAGAADKISAAVVERIGEAADAAAQTEPAKKTPEPS